MYNLLITGGSSAWDGEVFSLSAERFGEYTDEDIRSRFPLPFSAETVSGLQALPCLFAYEGIHDVRLGKITSISMNGGRIKIRFSLEKTLIPAGIFENLQHRLGVESDWELNRTHWAVKDVDLARVLAGAEILLPAFLRPSIEVADVALRGNVSTLPSVDVEFIRRRGSGAYGTVWEAREMLLERRIAVKFLTSTDEAYDQNALLKEARNLARIAHPNLVTIFAAAQMRHPETHLVAPAILMEYLDGPDLDDWWSVIHDPQHVLQVALQLVDGVMALHAGKIVHGDLHPKNVIVIGDAWPKVIDWRYHDAGLLRPTTYVRNELAAEIRRVYDLVDSLCRRQNVTLDTGGLDASTAANLADLRIRIRTAEAAFNGLADYGAMSQSFTFRTKAVAAVAQFLLTEGPAPRQTIQSKHVDMGLTATGVSIGIDIGLDDRMLEEVVVERERVSQRQISVTVAGRLALLGSLTEDDIYLAPTKGPP